MPSTDQKLVEGTLSPEPIAVAIRRAQAMVRASSPDSAGVVDELIAERRAAAESV